MNKSELVKALRDSGERAQAELSALPAERFEEGRYENGWNGRQILAHMASIEWTYPRLLDLARGAPPEPPKPASPPATAPSMASGSPKILSYNDRQVEKRADASVAELIAEFKENRAKTIAAVESADEALFTKEVTSAGGAKGPLATVIDFVAVQHVLGHLRDITGEA
jgi:hypothetical protein